VRILFDTNILLDVLLDRAPHVVPASRLMVHVERKRMEGLMGATSVTTIHYLATKAVGGARARRHLQTLLSLFDVAPVGRVVFSDALSLGFPDYEDAVLHEAARHAGATGIVTRDPGGFARASLHIYSPDELLTMVRALPPSNS
jgi:predicted nucleic acid-binding protein